MSLVLTISATAPAASAAGDDFVGLWERTDLELTWVISPVSEGVYHIEETFEGGHCGLTVVEDTEATVVDGVLMVDWVNTTCRDDPSVVGAILEGRTVTVQPDGSLVHEKPDGATYTMVRTSTEFFDVAVDQFYADAVTWLSSEGITTGATPTTYRPGDPVTRAQMATFLWRYDGRPEPASLDAPFVDVSAEAFYSKAVAWLAEEMITTGVTPTMFSPDDPVSRGQMATFLWRYSDSPAPASSETVFDDVPAGAFYSEAVAWLVDEGFTTGTTPTTFSPDELITRGQMATFLWRLGGDPPV
jgi:predicted enzyme related to lactoylglutathione lyase